MDINGTTTLNIKKIFMLIFFVALNLNLIAGNEYAVTTTKLNLRESNSKIQCH